MKETRFKQTEIGLIPEDWEVVTISKIAETSSGGTPSRSINRYYNGNIRWITTSELKDSRIYDSIEHITEEAVQNSSAKMFPKGTVLMAMYGATIGKLGILEVCSTTNQACCAIICRDIKNIYLFYYLFFIRKEIILQGCGAGQPNISQNIVKNINIGLPKEIEQKKIASALTSIDNLLLSLDKLIEKKRLIKQGVMQELLTGKKRLPGFTGEWIERQVKDLGSIGRGRVISQKEIERSYQHRYPVYSSQTQNNGVMGYIDTYDFEGEYITWTTDGVNAGTVFHRNGLFNCTNVCGTIKLHKDNHLFVSMRLGLETNNYVSTNLANPKLMNNVMKQIVIDLPETIEEQRAIATVLSSMDKEIESLEGKKAKYEQIKQGMMQQLLTGKIRLIS